MFGAGSSFSWTLYLESLERMLPSAVAAPELTDAAEPPSRLLFKPGDRLEAVDPRDPALICVCTVAEVTGRRTELPGRMIHVA